MQTLHLLWELKCSAIFRIATWRIMFANAMQIRFPFSESFVWFFQCIYFLSFDLPSPFSILQIRIESNAGTHTHTQPCFVYAYIGLVNVQCTNIQQCESDIFPFHSMMPANKVNNRKICQSIPAKHKNLHAWTELVKEAKHIHFAATIDCIWHGLDLELVEEIGDVAILMLRHRSLRHKEGVRERERL